MPRKGHIPKRDVLADPVYKNKVVTKLINNIMLDGKKGVAQKIVYGAFDEIAEKTGKDAIEVFEEAMNKLVNWENFDIIPKTIGLDNLIECYNIGKFPGLGVIKKYSLMHHIQMMGEYLEAR